MIFPLLELCASFDIGYENISFWVQRYHSINKYDKPLNNLTNSYLLVRMISWNSIFWEILESISHRMKNFL
jgi:hypothetical protein